MPLPPNKENKKSSSFLQKLTHFGGGRAQRLRLYYGRLILNALVLILKRYRQFYFSRPYLKSILFNLIGKKEDSLKIKNFVVLSCQEPLQVAKNQFKHFCLMYSSFQKVYKESKFWIQSEEFKKYYQNQPYPPYLNPQKVDYENILPDLAWDLNLPVPPQKYHCLNISNGLSASAATLMFFKECEVNTISFHMTAKEWYKDFLRKTNKEKNAIFCYDNWFISHYYDWLGEYANHLKAMLPKNVPFLYIIRDPISRIKGILNHVSDAKGYIKQFNLSFDVESLIQKETYCHSKKIYPTFELLENASHFKNDEQWWAMWWRASLATDSLLETFKENIGEIYCVEFNDLKPNKAIETFSKIADFFDFQMPEDKSIFTQRVWNEMYNFLPNTFYVNENDLNNKNNKIKNEESFNQQNSFVITITLPSKITPEEKSLVDISCEIKENLIMDDSRILILIKENDLIKLKENQVLYQAALDYLKNYLNEIQKEIDRRRSVVFKEEDVLNFFKNNPKSRKFIQNILNSELNYIRQNHPDFIQRWHYYLEFEKLCLKCGD